MAQSTKYYLYMQETPGEKTNGFRKEKAPVEIEFASEQECRDKYTKEEKAKMSGKKFSAYVLEKNHAVDGSGDNRSCRLIKIEDVN